MTGWSGAPGFGPDGPTLEIFQYEESLIKAEIISRGGSPLGEVVSKELPSGNLVFTFAASSR
ncbi:MAG: hypothetical protein DRP70_12080 [Spirochaetes bacterium]|nr:MAG: hypothetical protein DRP70_12080 [Spirochaetota bacterium]